MLNEEKNVIVNESSCVTKNKDLNCKEYQALKYKTMITTGTNIEKKIDNETNEEQLNNFLEKELKMNKKQSWNKLTKTEKIKKIKNYITSGLQNEYSLNDEELLLTKRYVLTLLDRKKLTKNHELDYNEETGEIEKINIIEFNSKSRKFTLNKSTKKVSSKKVSQKNKNKSIKENVKE